MKIAQTVFLLSLNSNNNTENGIPLMEQILLSISIYTISPFSPLSLTLSLFLYLTNSNTKSLQIPLISNGKCIRKDFYYYNYSYEIQ